MAAKRTCRTLTAVMLTGLALAVNNAYEIIIVSVGFPLSPQKSVEYTEDGVPYFHSIAMPEID